METVMDNSEIEMKKQNLIIPHVKRFDYDSKIKMEKQVTERYLRWNSKNTFEWSEVKSSKPLALNDTLIKKEDELYKILSNVKEDMDTLLSSDKKYYEVCDIDAFLSYEADEYATPTGDEETVFDVYSCGEINTPTLCVRGCFVDLNPNYFVSCIETRN